MSEIRATTISDAAGTGPITLTKQSAAKAWVNFNGTGTVAIRDSFNLSSLSDLGTGVYDVSFSNSMATADYVSNANVANINVYGNPIILTVSGSELRSYYPHGTQPLDVAYYWNSVMGDLA